MPVSNLGVRIRHPDPNARSICIPIAPSTIDDNDSPVDLHLDHWALIPILAELVHTGGKGDEAPCFTSLRPKVPLYIPSPSDRTSPEMVRD